MSPTRLAKTIALVYGLFLSTFSYAQKNYLPGKIITTQNDTIAGYIDYRNWEKNPVEIRFKKEESSSEVIYSPLQISRFEVNNEAYIGAIVESEISPSKINLLQRGSTPVIRMDTVFLQVLIEGPVSLYHYKNDAENDNFYIQENSAFELLIYKKYLLGEEGKTLMNENKKYIGQLTLYLGNCPTIQSKINTTIYNERSLLNLFETYYKCIGIESNHQQRPQNTRVEAGALTGITLNTLKLEGQGNIHLLNADYTSSPSLTIGLFVDIVFTKNLGRWSVNNELNFLSHTITGKSTVQTDPNQYSEGDITLDLSYLKLSNMLRYRLYSKEGISVYANFGVSNGFMIAENKNQQITRTTFHGTETTTEKMALEEIRKHEQALLLGFGARRNKLSAEIRVEQGNGMSAFSKLNSTRRSLYLTIGYKF
jgi:hypothetical protein